jgi:hypothetical protein
MLTFLKVLTELDCELDWDALPEEPLAPLLWLELELEDDEDELADASTFLKMTPDKAWPLGHKLSP